MTYSKDTTGLVLIDPYNDFISSGGKVWERLRGVIESNDCVTHMKQVLDAARAADIRVFYALHRPYRPGDYETWKHICAGAEGGVVARDLRVRHLGRGAS